MRYAYDEFDRVTHHADPFGAEARYGYDSNGNRTSLRTQDARITRYSFDGLNRLSTVGGAGGSAGFAYDARGLVIAFLAWDRGRYDVFSTCSATQKA